jgi:hypothetical protein
MIVGNAEDNACPAPWQGAAHENDSYDAASRLPGRAPAARVTGSEFFADFSGQQGTP